MQELRTNFQNKYGQAIPLPKIYQDEDSSDSEGLELADGTTVGKKTAGGAGCSGGANHVRRLQPVVAAVEQEDQAVATAPVQVVAAVSAQVVAVA